jgi:hypothetical protein
VAAEVLAEVLAEGSAVASVVQQRWLVAVGCSVAAAVWILPCKNFNYLVVFNYLFIKLIFFKFYIIIYYIININTEK